MRETSFSVLKKRFLQVYMWLKINIYRENKPPKVKWNILLPTKTPWAIWSNSKSVKQCCQIRRVTQKSSGLGAKYASSPVKFYKTQNTWFSWTSKASCLENTRTQQRDSSTATTKKTWTESYLNCHETFCYSRKNKYKSARWDSSRSLNGMSSALLLVIYYRRAQSNGKETQRKRGVHSEKDHHLDAHCLGSRKSTNENIVFNRTFAFVFPLITRKSFFLSITALLLSVCIRVVLP